MSRIEGAGGLVAADQDGVGIGGAAGVDRAVAAGFDDAVEGGAIHRQVLQRRKGAGAEGFQGEGGSVGEGAQVKLADRGEG